MDDETRGRFDNLDARVEGIRIDMNGRLRGLELWKAKIEGALLGGRLLPLLPVYIAAGAALVVALR